MTLWRDLVVALMFLTRLPVRSSTPWKDDDLASSVIMFPIAGALVGVIGAFSYALSTLIGLPPFLAASITLLVMIAVTGALHEDGLADVADGFGGGRTKDDKLRIMRDSRLGSYGTLALGFSLLLRIGALAAIAHPLSVGMALIATSALSRAAIPAAMTLMSQAREDGLATKAGRPHAGRAIVAAFVALLIACACLAPPQAFAVFAVSLFGAGVFLLHAQRQIAGITGDVLGALQQIAEILGLIALAAVMSQA